MELLEIKNLQHMFGGLKAISDLNIKVKPRMIYGVIGANGAGKTTLFNLITGIYRPTVGQILLEGKSLVGKQSYEISRLGVARTFQNLRLFNDLTVIENIHIGQIYTNRGRGKNKTTKDLPGEIRRLLELFGLDERATEKAGNLPYGMQRKLEIARALATDPKLLLLDEPAAGMNPKEVMGLVNLIKEVKNQYPDITIVLIEHQMKLVEGLCEYVSVMNFGQIIANGIVREVQSNPIVIKAYLGETEVG
ncbi:ABC transporter ATP-binding protein [Desulfosporosinus sp.]|uniref:ABC transporter ATP-binding protein n=1 Tax=Desulfosporosinus sp. TaxID=157907 RepID=UPI0025BE7EE8|nr:ABC transporter ATP-binding protein [Desulfosporosinus sp.]MBC2725941.1 ABC transporter ATP-binding protein [Desulfosporosinus sp.]